MVDFARHAAACYRILGKPATVSPAAGGPTAFGRAILNAPGAILLGGAVVADSPSAQYPTADFPAVAPGDVLTLGGTAYIVRTPPDPSQDGLEAVVLLDKP